MDKINKWADDRKNSLKVSLNLIEEEINAKKHEARIETDAKKKLALAQEVRDLERKQGKLQRDFYDSRSQIDDEKDILFLQMSANAEQKIEETELFTIKWKIV